MLLPIVQNVAVRGFINPHAKAGVEKLPFFTLPVCGKLNVLPIHAGKIAVGLVLGRPEPQNLQGAYPLKPQTTGSLLCLRVLPEPDG